MQVIWAAHLGHISLHIIPYDPFGVGELLVRLKTRTFSGRITAPALLTTHGERHACECVPVQVQALLTACIQV